MTQGQDPGLRESAFRVFAGSNMLVMDLQTDAVLRVLKGGHGEYRCKFPFESYYFPYWLIRSVRQQVRLAALRASTSYLTSSNAHQLAQSLSLLYPMLDTFPSLPQSHFPKFISTLTRLATTNPTLFQPHLWPLLGFLAALILPSADPRRRGETVPYKRKFHFPSSS